MLAESLSPCSSSRVWWKPHAFSPAPSRCARHSLPVVLNAFSSSTASYPMAASDFSVPGMSLASCFRTHQSCVPMGTFFQLAAAARSMGARSAEAAAAPPSRRMSRRVGCTEVMSASFSSRTLEVREPSCSVAVARANRLSIPPDDVCVEEAGREYANRAIPCHASQGDQGDPSQGDQEIKELNSFCISFGVVSETGRVPPRSRDLPVKNPQPADATN